jgi:hypothetical protein
MTAVGTDRRLRNVCVHGGYLGQNGPEMPNARLSQDDPDSDIGSIYQTRSDGKHPLEAVMSLRVCKAHLCLTRAQPSGTLSCAAKHP